MDDHETEEEETTTKRLPRGVRVGEQLSLTGDDEDITPPPSKGNMKGDEYDSIPDLADLELATQYHVVDRTFRRRQLLKRLAAAFGVILVVVGVSVGIAFLISSSSSQSSSAAAATSGSSVIVPPPPPDLAQLCDASNLLADVGRAQCKAACAPAACCASTLESCKSTNVETCEAYSSACLLHQNATPNQPEMSDNEKLITTLCEDTTDLESMKQCKKLCSARDCCFSTDNYSGYICYDDFKEWCDEYKICASVQSSAASTTASSSPVEPLVSEPSTSTQPPAVTPTTDAPVSMEKTLVQQVCSMDAISIKGTKQCADLCRARACCFVDESEFNCIQERADWCSEYSLCTILNMGGGGSINPTNTTTPPPTESVSTASEVEEKCSFDFMIAYGTDPCKNLCEEGQCCFTADDTSCAVNLKEWCLRYTTCKNLMGLGSATSNVSNTTDTSSVTEASEFINTTEAPISNMATPVIDNSTVIPDTVTAACSLDFIAASGQDQCEKLCDRGKCCFAEDETNCSIDLEEFCLQFKECVNLKGAPSSSSISEAASITNMSLPEPAVAAVVTVAPTQVPISNFSITGAPYIDTVNTSCTTEAIAANGKEKCRALCKERACCFIEGDFNCYAERQTWCNEYSACKVLSTNETSTPAAAAVNLIPTQAPVSIYGDLGASTAATNAPSPLIIVVLNSTEVPVSTESIFNEVVTPNAPMNVSMSPVSNYANTVTSEAPAQQPVTSVSIYGSMEGTTAPVAVPNNTVTLNVNDVCAPEAIAANGENECHSVCLERQCCFLPGDSNCSTTLRDWCEEYKACYILPSFQT